MADSTTSGTSGYMALVSWTALVPLTPGSSKSSTNNSGVPCLMMAAGNSLNFSSSTTTEVGRSLRSSMPMAWRTKGWSSMTNKLMVFLQVSSSGRWPRALRAWFAVQ